MNRRTEIAQELLKVAKTVVSGERRLIFEKTYHLDFVEKDYPTNRNPSNLFNDIVTDFGSVVNTRLNRSDLVTSCDVEAKPVGTPKIEILPPDDFSLEYQNIHYTGTIEVKVFVPWYDESKIGLLVAEEVRRFLGLRKP